MNQYNILQVSIGYVVRKAEVKINLWTSDDTPFSSYIF